MTTPEEMYYEWRQAFDESLDERMCKGEPIQLQLLHRELGKETFLAGYKAAQDQLADTSKVITYDYVETASNEAKELIAQFELKGDEDVIVKALVAAYCRGVDAVDGYLRNSLSAYRASVKRQQWISVTDRLPEGGKVVLVAMPKGTVTLGGIRKKTQAWDVFLDMAIWTAEPTHWQSLPEPPKEEK